MRYRSSASRALAGGREKDAASARRELEALLTFLRTLRPDASAQGDNVLRGLIAACIRATGETCVLLRDLPAAARHFRMAASRYDILASRLPDRTTYALCAVECSSAAHALRQHDARNGETPPDFPRRAAAHMATLHASAATLEAPLAARLARLKPLTHTQPEVSPEDAAAHPEAHGIFFSQPAAARE